MLWFLEYEVYEYGGWHWTTEGPFKTKEGAQARATGLKNANVYSW